MTPEFERRCAADGCTGSPCPTCASDGWLGGNCACCDECGGQGTVLTPLGTEVLELVRRHLVVEGQLVNQGGTWVKGRLRKQ